MGSRILFLCLLYETTVISSTGAVTLPFTDLVATVTPIKPKPLTTDPSTGKPTPQLPKAPSSDAILAYFKSRFLKTDTTDIKCEFSSPLVLSSTSKTAPLPKIERLNTDDKLNNFNLSPPIVQSYSESSKCNTKSESNILKSDAFLPYKLSPSLKMDTSFMLPCVSRSTPQMYNNFSPYSYVPNTPMASKSSLFYSDISRFTPNAVISVPTISSLPTVSLDPLRRSADSYAAIPQYSCSSSVPSLSHPYSSPISQLPTPCLSPFNSMSYRTMASLNPSYSLPYPLRYNMRSLPAVVTPSNINPVKSRPVSCTDCKYSNVPSPSLIGRSSFNNNFSPLFFENPYTQRLVPRVPSASSNINKFISDTRLPTSLCTSSLPRDSSLPESDPFDFTPTHFEFNSPMQFENNLNINLVNANDCKGSDFISAVDAIINEMDSNLCKGIINFQEGFDLDQTVQKFSKSVPYFIPDQEILTDYVEPQISLMPSSIANLCSNVPELRVKNIPQSFPSPTIYPSRLPQTSIVPSSYINVTPSNSICSSSAVSSLNNVVSDITQNILSSFMSYIKSLPIRQDIKPANPYVSPQRVYPRTRTYPHLKAFNNKPTVPILSQRTNKPIMTSLNAFSAPTNTFLEPSFNSLAIPITTSPTVDNDYSSSSFISYLPVIDISPTQAIENPSLTPVEVTIIPPMSFGDYSIPQPCPSVLPSPIIPPYLDFSAAFEPQIIKLNNFGKNTKTIEKLLELVLLTELVNGDTYVDWDALDTVLALLCANK